jgi:hypothetical protein
MYEERNYIIFNVEELDKIDFDNVLETSADTVRKSVDGTLTFVKWNGDTPDCISLLTTKTGPYTHAEILTILNSEQWSSNQNSV